MEGGLSWKAVCNIVYPVGSIYMSTSSTNPSTLFGGTWTAWGQGRVPVGVGATSGDLVTATEAEGTGGSTYSEKHTHNVTASGSVSSTFTGTKGTTSENGKHKHDVEVTKFNDIGNGTQGSWWSYEESEKSSSSTASGTAKEEGDHTHTFTPSGTVSSTFTGTTVTSTETGTGTSGNVQPYITCYMWKRTA